MHRSILLCAVAVAAATAHASATSVTIGDIDASWTSITGGSFHNIDNDPRPNGWVTAKWGLPATIIGPQSGLGFKASDTPKTVNIGEAFTLGTLRHFNRPVWAGTAASGAALEVSISFSDPAGLESAFAFSFEINETPNSPWDGVSDSDIVSFPSAFARETISIGGMLYTLQIIGFLQGNSVVEQFISPENCDSDATIMARLVEAPTGTQPVPTPAAGLAGSLGLGVLAARRRR